MIKGWIVSFLMVLVVGFAFGVAQEKQSAKRPERLRHVVSFKFKASVSEAEIAKVNRAFRGLKKKIPSIAAIEMGQNNSPEGLNKGFTHCYVLTFRKAEDRDNYLVHPDHKAFAETLGPLLEDVFVVDFWAK